ncbi:MAG TPA: hypothetical protein VFD41_09355, partial [Actinomycetales bacterium]|nr:hypothetical protein [Actinomycetales bacterium]
MTGSGSRRRAAGLVGAALVAFAATFGISVVGAAPARAAACQGDEGVTVVVDFGSLGGTSVRCAAGDPGSGVGALEMAGFVVTGTQQYGKAFVCRIDGLPTDETEPCGRTPSGQQYWSYSYAEPGGSWTYSGSGASNRDPVPGSVEGWKFGA